MQLKEFVLKIDINNFIELFWLNQEWYKSLLIEKLGDINIEIFDWEKSVNETNVWIRKVNSHHPSKAKFPGLPKYHKSFKYQILTMKQDNEKSIVSVKESNSFKEIPYADYFEVLTELIFIFPKNSGASQLCNAKVTFDIVFHKNTILARTIVSNTKSELIEVYHMWYDHAIKYIDTLDLLNNASKDKQDRSIDDKLVIYKINYHQNQSLQSTDYLDKRIVKLSSRPLSTKVINQINYFVSFFAVLMIIRVLFSSLKKRG